MDHERCLALINKLLKCSNSWKDSAQCANGEEMGRVIIPRERRKRERGREREREREISWYGILLKEPNPNREPTKRPNWALCVSRHRKPHPPNTQGRGKPNTCGYVKAILPQRNRTCSRQGLCEERTVEGTPWVHVGAIEHALLRCAHASMRAMHCVKPHKERA